MSRKQALDSFGLAVALFMLTAAIPFAYAQATEIPPNSASKPAVPIPDVLGTFHKLSVRSGTVYMKNEQMEDALRRQPEIAAGGLEVVNDTSSADLVLQVNRPLMTFDWAYKLIDANTEAVVLSGKVSGFDGGVASSRIALELVQRIRVLRPLPATEASTSASVSDQSPSSAPVNATPADVLRQCKSVFVRSTTVYLREELLRSAFQERPEFAAWGLKLSRTSDSADVIIEITRPVFTFDWTYKVTERRAGTELLSGKVVAWDGQSAAPKLAANIVDLIRVSRPTPDLSTASPSHGRETTRGQQSWSVRDVSIGFETVQIIHLPENETRVSLNITQDEITISSGLLTAVKIPMTSIVAISYDTETTNTGPADAYWKFWDDSIRWADPEPEAATFQVLAMAPIMYAGSVIPELEKKRHNNVSILHLASEGKVERVRFEVPKDHRQLLAALQTATGIEWTDLSKAAEELKKGPESRLIHQGRLVTDRQLQLGPAKLPAGTYSILLLPKNDSHGKIFVFAGEVTTEPLTGADVEIYGISRGVPGIVSATYLLRPDTNVIDEIHFGGRVVRLVAAQ